MKRFSFLSAFGVCALLATAANAGIVGSATVVAPPFAAPDAALTGFVAYQLSIATDDGSLISAVDVSMLGKFHQRWSDTDFDGIPNPSPNGPASNGRGDTHLTLISGALVGSAPTENNNIFPSPLPDGVFDYGVGTILGGAWGIPGPSQTTGANLAYIVIPEGSIPTMSINVQVATSNGTFPLDLGDFFVLVPEPSSMIMAGMGLIGLAFRRRNA